MPSLSFPSVSPYLEQRELRNFYAQAEIDQLADRDGDNAPDVDVFDVIDAAIQRGAAELDSYLAKCYPLPLRPSEGFAVIQEHVSWLLAEWVGVIARYRLWEDVRIHQQGEQKTEPRLRYEDLLKRLGGIDPCKNCGCDLLGPSVLTNEQAGIGPGVDMPMLASNGSVWQRTDYDFRRGDQDGVANKHGSRAWNALQ